MPRMTDQEAREFLDALARDKGVPVQQGDIEDLARRNAEDVPGVQQAYRDQYARRAAPTFSNGGSGGDADVNGDRVMDDGFARSPVSGGRSVVRRSELPTLEALAGLGGDPGYDRGPGGVLNIQTAPLSANTLGGLAGVRPRPRQTRWWGSF